MIKGSCLCGKVVFAIDGNFGPVGQCHCSKCRKVSGTDGNAVFYTSVKSFRWLGGEEEIRRFLVPGSDGWQSTFCGTCGSPVPHTDSAGKIYFIPAGLAMRRTSSSAPRRRGCASPTMRRNMRKASRRRGLADNPAGQPSPSHCAMRSSSARSASCVCPGAPGSRWVDWTISRRACRSALRSTRATSRSPSRKGST